MCRLPTLFHTAHLRAAKAAKGEAMPSVVPQPFFIVPFWEQLNLSVGGSLVAEVCLSMADEGLVHCKRGIPSHRSMAFEVKGIARWSVMCEVSPPRRNLQGGRLPSRRDMAFEAKGIA